MKVPCCISPINEKHKEKTCMPPLRLQLCVDRFRALKHSSIVRRMVDNLEGKRHCPEDPSPTWLGRRRRPPNRIARCTWLFCYERHAHASASAGIEAGAQFHVVYGGGWNCKAQATIRLRKDTRYTTHQKRRAPLKGRYHPVEPALPFLRQLVPGPCEL